MDIKNDTSGLISKDMFTISESLDFILGQTTYVVNAWTYHKNMNLNFHQASKVIVKSENMSMEIT